MTVTASGAVSEPTGDVPRREPLEAMPPPRVAYQGEPGAFGEAAARAHFGTAAVCRPCSSFGDVVAAVGRGAVDYAVLPVHNTIVGPISAACAALDAGGLQPIAEVLLPVRQQVLGLPGATLDEIRAVLSHPAALAQCERFFASHPALRAVPVEDTAGAAREVAARGDPSLAAIAGSPAAALYGLSVLAADVHDRAENFTRFVVLAAPRPGG